MSMLVEAWWRSPWSSVIPGSKHTQMSQARSEQPAIGWLLTAPCP